MRCAPLSVIPRTGVASAVLLCLCASAFADPAVPDATAKRVRALRAEGTRLLHAKQIPAACLAFESASRLAPADPGAVVDLALCEQRRGNSERARTENLTAIGLASAAERIQDPHFGRVRRSAYFNLDQLPEPSEGARAAEPAVSHAPDQDCARLPPELGCSKAFSVCSKQHAGGGAQVRTSATVVRLALNEADASFEDGEDLEGNELEDDSGSAVPRQVASGNSFTFNGSYSLELLQYVCEADEWSCDKSLAVAAEAEACVHKAGSGSEARCQEQACAHAQNRPSPAVSREQRAAERASDECYKQCAASEESSDCNVAYANACTGLVGIVCRGRTGQAGGDWTRVTEVAFEPGATN
jgi:hypothetical protein